MNADKQNNFIVLYQCLLAILAVAIFFTSTDIYLYDSGKIPPIQWLVFAFVLASTPLIPSFLNKNFKYLPIAILKWCGFYYLLSLLYYQFATHNEIVNQEFRDRTFTLLFLLVMLFIFSGKEIVQQSARWAIFLAVFWDMYTYIYELFNPEVWKTLTTINESLGRAAGFYVNSNKAGLALIYGMLFSIHLLPKKYRLYFAIIVFLGVLTTFSRGAIICWSILVLLFFAKNIIHRSQFIYFLLPLLFLILNLQLVGDYLQSAAFNLGISTYDMQTRIATFTNPASREASDDSSRIDIIGFALQKFYEQPVLGQGLAYDQQWQGEVRPHNLYLTYMVQHGMIGIFIVPSLAFCVIKDAHDHETKNLGILFLILFLISSFFSHTLLYNRENILVYALMAVLSKKSSLKNVNQSGNRTLRHT